MVMVESKECGTTSNIIQKKYTWMNPVLSLYVLEDDNDAFLSECRGLSSETNLLDGSLSTMRTARREAKVMWTLDE